MLAIIFLPLLLASPEPPSAEALAAEGEAYLKAAETAERPLDVLLSAHTSFDSAYLDGDDPGYLCRALDVTGRALQLPTLADEQERKFWEETRREDLDRLQRDAAEKRRANCRYDSAGKAAQPRVALLAADDPPAALVLPTPLDVPPATARRTLNGPSRTQVHRERAHTAMGAVLTGAGIGMLGILAGILELERQRAVEVRGIIEAAKAERRGYTPAEERRYFELRDDLVRGRDAAIGVGVAGLVSLGTGVALLATRKKARSRSYALAPYGGPQGAGAVLRLRF